jgi:hypothetical protein
MLSRQVISPDEQRAPLTRQSDITDTSTFAALSAQCVRRQNRWFIARRLWRGNTSIVELPVL